MNIWQKIFIGIGAISSGLLLLFPPQIVFMNTVQFLPFNAGYPVDWLRLFLWVDAILFVTILGVTINKTEHTG